MNTFISVKQENIFFCLLQLPKRSIISYRAACPSSLFHTWETFLQEVEIDSQALGDLGSLLGRQISRPLLEKSFYRKIQSRKVFTHRESYETIIAKTEEKLVKVGHVFLLKHLLCFSFKSSITQSSQTCFSGYIACRFSLGYVRFHLTYLIVLIFCSGYHVIGN